MVGGAPDAFVSSILERGPSLEKQLAGPRRMSSAEIGDSCAICRSVRRETRSRSASRRSGGGGALSDETEARETARRAQRRRRRESPAPSSRRGGGVGFRLALRWGRPRERRRDEMWTRVTVSSRERDDADERHLKSSEDDEERLTPDAGGAQRRRNDAVSPSARGAGSCAYRFFRRVFHPRGCCRGVRRGVAGREDPTSDIHFSRRRAATCCIRVPSRGKNASERSSDLM